MDRAIRKGERAGDIIMASPEGKDVIVTYVPIQFRGDPQRRIRAIEKAHKNKKSKPGENIERKTSSRGLDLKEKTQLIFEDLMIALFGSTEFDPSDPENMERAFQLASGERHVVFGQNMSPPQIDVRMSGVAHFDGASFRHEAWNGAINMLSRVITPFVSAIDA